MEQVAPKQLTCIKQTDVWVFPDVSRAANAYTTDDRRVYAQGTRRRAPGSADCTQLMQVIDSPEAQLQATRAVHLVIRISR